MTRWRAGRKRARLAAMRGDPCYELIRAFYGDGRARRSGVRLMDHIDQGLVLLEALGASPAAQRAFCLHPLVQAGAPLGDALDAEAVALARAYAEAAGAALSTRPLASPDDIALSPHADVNLMLVADKVQNRKDFERHHAATHPRSEALARYFSLWLTRLGISEPRYRELAALIA